MPSSSDLDLKLKISANPADAVDGLLKTREGITRLDDAIKSQTESAAQSKKEFIEAAREEAALVQKIGQIKRDVDALGSSAKGPKAIKDAIKALNTELAESDKDVAKLTKELAALEMQSAKPLSDKEAKELAASFDYLFAEMEKGKGKSEALRYEIALAAKALESSELAARQAKEQQARLKDELKADTAALKDLSKATADADMKMQSASAASDKLSRELDQLKQSEAQQSAALKDAGINVQHLALEYERLGTAARKAAQLASARDTLGVKPFADIEAEITRVRQAFETLQTSGKLSQSEIAQAALKTQQRIDELRHSTNGWGDALIQAKAKFIEAGVAAGGLTAAAHQAIQFETALAQVAKTTGMTAEQTARLGDRIKAMAGQLPVSADALAGMAAAAGQLGIANKDIEAFVNLAAKMSSAFDIPAEQAGEAIAKLTNNFQLAIPQVDRLGDAINVLGNTTAAKEKDIVDALSRIGGNAKQFGLSAEQASALSATLLAMGIPAEQAGTAINAMLSKLQTARVGSKDFREGLEEIGMSANQMADAVKANPQKALTDLLHTLDKLDAQSRAEVLTQMFGLEHSDEIARLVNGLKDYDQALDRVSNTAQTAGAMQKEFAAKVATTESHLALLKNSVEVAAINLGQIFLPAIRSVADGLKTATQAVADFENAFPGIAGVAASLATLAASVGALRLAWLALASVGAKGFDWMRDIGPVASKGLDEAAASAGKLKVALAGLAGLSVGWDIGAWARKEFETVYKAGVGLVGALTIGAEQVRYGWEAAMAVFNGDTIEAATRRHEERLAKIVSNSADMLTTWKISTEKQADATEKVTEAVAKVAPALNDAKQAMSQFVGESDKLKGFSEQLGKITSGTKEAKDEWEKYLGTVKGEDLAAIIGEANEKMEKFGPIIDQNSEQMRQWQAAIDAALRESLTRAGLDAEKALTGVGTETRAGIAQFESLRQTLDATGMDGKKAGAIIAESFTNLIGKAKTTQDLDAIREKLNEYRQSTRASFSEMLPFYTQLEQAQTKIRASTTEIDAAQDQAAKSADAVAEAYKNGKVPAELLAQATLDAAHAASLQASASDASAAATARASDANLAHASVQKEMAQHDAAVAAQRRQNAAEAQAQAQARRQAAAAEIRDGKTVTQMWDQATAAALSYGDKGWEAMQTISRAIGGAGASWNLYFEIAGRWTEQAAKQAETVDRLTGNLQQATQTGHGLGDAIASASKNFDKMDANHLEKLNAALDAARAKVRDLEDAIAGRLNNLADELDRKLGNEQAIEQRRWQEQQKQIKQDVEVAKGLGSKDALAKAKEEERIAKQIHDLNMKEAQARQQEAQQAKAQGTGGGSPAAPQSQPQPQHAGTVNFDALVNGQKIPLKADSHEQVNTLIKQIGRAGQRTVRR